MMFGCPYAAVANRYIIIMTSPLLTGAAAAAMAFHFLTNSCAYVIVW